ILFAEKLNEIGGNRFVYISKNVILVFSIRAGIFRVFRRGRRGNRQGLNVQFRRRFQFRFSRLGMISGPYDRYDDKCRYQGPCEISVKSKTNEGAQEETEFSFSGDGIRLEILPQN